MSERRSKQWTTRIAYEALQKVNPNHKLLKLIIFNDDGEFKLTQCFIDKYVQPEDMGEFHGYGRYRVDLENTKKELIE